MLFVAVVLSIQFINHAEGSNNPCGQHGYFCTTATQFKTCVDYGNGTMLPAETPVQDCGTDMMCSDTTLLPCLDISQKHTLEFQVTVEMLPTSTPATSKEILVSTPLPLVGTNETATTENNPPQNSKANSTECTTTRNIHVLININAKEKLNKQNHLPPSNSVEQPVTTTKTKKQQNYSSIKSVSHTGEIVMIQKGNSTSFTVYPVVTNVEYQKVPIKTSSAYSTNGSFTTTGMYNGIPMRISKTTQCCSRPNSKLKTFKKPASLIGCNTDNLVTVIINDHTNNESPFTYHIPIKSEHISSQTLLKKNGESPRAEIAESNNTDIYAILTASKPAYKITIRTTRNHPKAISTFVCRSPGYFPDPSKNCSLYYQCNSTTNGHFVLTKNSCPDGQEFSEKLKKCTSTAEANCSILLPAQASSNKNNTLREFVCKKSGKFADITNYSAYYICSPRSGGEFHQVKFCCPPSSQFHPDALQCIVTSPPHSPFSVGPTVHTSPGNPTLLTNVSKTKFANNSDKFKPTGEDNAADSVHYSAENPSTPQEIIYTNGPIHVTSETKHRIQTITESPVTISAREHVLEMLGTTVVSKQMAITKGNSVIKENSNQDKLDIKMIIPDLLHTNTLGIVKQDTFQDVENITETSTEFTSIHVNINSPTLEKPVYFIKPAKESHIADNTTASGLPALNNFTNKSNILNENIKYESTISTESTMPNSYMNVKLITPQEIEFTHTSMPTPNMPQEKIIPESSTPVTITKPKLFVSQEKTSLVYTSAETTTFETQISSTTKSKTYTPTVITTQLHIPAFKKTTNLYTPSITITSKPSIREITIVPKSHIFAETIQPESQISQTEITPQKNMSATITQTKHASKETITSEPYLNAETLIQAFSIPETITSESNIHAKMITPESHTSAKTTIPELHKFEAITTESNSYAETAITELYTAAATTSEIYTQTNDTTTPNIYTSAETTFSESYTAAATTSETYTQTKDTTTPDSYTSEETNFTESHTPAGTTSETHTQTRDTTTPDSYTSAETTFSESYTPAGTTSETYTQTKDTTTPDSYTSAETTFSESYTPAGTTSETYTQTRDTTTPDSYTSAETTFSESYTPASTTSETFTQTNDITTRDSYASAETTITESYTPSVTAPDTYTKAEYLTVPELHKSAGITTHESYMPAVTIPETYTLEIDANMPESYIRTSKTIPKSYTLAKDTPPESYAHAKSTTAPETHKTTRTNVSELYTQAKTSTISEIYVSAGTTIPELYTGVKDTIPQFSKQEKDTTTETYTPAGTTIPELYTGVKDTTIPQFYKQEKDTTSETYTPAGTTIPELYTGVKDTIPQFSKQVKKDTETYTPAGTTIPELYTGVKDTTIPQFSKQEKDIKTETYTPTGTAIPKLYTGVKDTTIPQFNTQEKDTTTETYTPAGTTIPEPEPFVITTKFESQTLATKIKPESPVYATAVESKSYMLAEDTTNSESLTFAITNTQAATHESYSSAGTTVPELYMTSAETLNYEPFTPVDKVITPVMYTSSGPITHESYTSTVTNISETNTSAARAVPNSYTTAKTTTPDSHIFVQTFTPASLTAAQSITLKSSTSEENNPYKELLGSQSIPEINLNSFSKSTLGSHTHGDAHMPELYTSAVYVPESYNSQVTSKPEPNTFTGRNELETHNSLQRSNEKELPMSHTSTAQISNHLSPLSSTRYTNISQNNPLGEAISPAIYSPTEISYHNKTILPVLQFSEPTATLSEAPISFTHTQMDALTISTETSITSQSTQTNTTTAVQYITNIKNDSITIFPTTSAVTLRTTLPMSLKDDVKVPLNTTDTGVTQHVATFQISTTPLSTSQLTSVGIFTSSLLPTKGHGAPLSKPANTNSVTVKKSTSAQNYLQQLNLTNVHPSAETNSTESKTASQAPTTEMSVSVSNGHMNTTRGDVARQATIVVTPFVCTSSGTFADIANCSAYYTCSLRNTGGFYMGHFFCPPSSLYHAETGRCTVAKAVECTTPTYIVYKNTTATSNTSN